MSAPAAPAAAAAAASSSAATAAAAAAAPPKPVVSKRASYRDTLTPAQQLYTSLCGKNKVRPDSALCDALAARALRASIDKYTAGDISVAGMLLRKLKGFTAIALKCAAGNVGQATSRRARRSASLHPGPVEEDIVSLCSAIAKSLSIAPKLGSIALPGVRISGAGLKHLGRGLCATASLRRLDLARCGLGDDGLAVLLKALVNCKSLNDLSLAGNRLKDSSAPRVSSIVRRHGARRDDGFWATCLRDGSMTSCRARGLEPTDAEVAVQLKGLTALDLSDNGLTDVGVQHIVTTLESDSWLVALNLRGNQVTQAGADAVKAALHVNESLSVIDFRPRQEPPKFDDMGYLIKSPSRKNARETMGWAMRRRPRKGIGADHPAVHAVLARWGLASPASPKGRSPRQAGGATGGSGRKTLRKGGAAAAGDAKVSEEKGATKKDGAKGRKKKTRAQKKGGSRKLASPSSSQTRMAMSKGRAGKRAVTTDAVDSKRSEAAPAAAPKAKKVLRKKGKKKGAKAVAAAPPAPSSSIAAAFKAPPAASGANKMRRRKKKSKSPSSGAPSAAAAARQQRPQSARGSSRRAFGGAAAMERPKTASGGTRSRRHKAGGSGSNRHPGIVGLGAVEPTQPLGAEARRMLNTVFDQVLAASGDAATGANAGMVAVRDIIAALRDMPSASDVLQFRDSGNNPPVDLLEQGKLISRSALLVFFEQHAQRVFAASPRGKASPGKRWAQPRGSGASPSTTDPEMIEVLEGWVGQLHGYIDEIEQGRQIALPGSSGSGGNGGASSAAAPVPGKTARLCVRVCTCDIKKPAGKPCEHCLTRSRFVSHLPHNTPALLRRRRRLQT